MVSSRKILKDALIDQVLEAFALDGKLDTPFLYQIAEQKADDLIWLFQHRRKLLKTTPEDEQRADQYAQMMDRACH